uniref:Glycosyltransferase n=1 Tax=Clarkia gracilis subsp. sonomensis TaxID=1906248 RepID=A0A7S9FTM1_9MYRT|nr:UDP-glucose:flavonoid 3-o-glucosyltransferase [Clarkia gracilis subsp. sonomensis]QPF47163.1 UDP-glucose:flavonoid 3-o-glucosyltransferase [Clarkia gracilis subsp. sonomensis]
MSDKEAKNTTAHHGQPHVAVLAFPFSTHAAPLLAATRRLAAASPTTLFSFFNTAVSNRSLGLSAGTHGNIRAYDISDGVPEGYVFAGKPQEEIELFMRAAPARFREGVEAAGVESGRRVRWLLTDAFFWFAAEMASEIEAPWVAFWTAGPTSLSAHIYTDLIRDNFKGSLTAAEAQEDETPLDFIPGMSKIRVRDLPEGILFGNLKSLFSDMLHRMGRALPSAAAVFLNSFEELDPAITDDLTSKLTTFLSIGPTNLLHKPPLPSDPDTDACLHWLDAQKPVSVVYVSFGSVTVPPRGELAALAEGLEVSGAPFLWSLKKSEDLPEGFVERTRRQGKVVPWAPQEAILSSAATGAFVTHCGWNSLLESVAGGVPMICRPFFGDQRINGRVVEGVLGIGVKLEGGVVSKEGLVRALGVVLLGEEGREMRKKMKLLREKAEWAVGAQGSSTRNFNQLVKLVDLS